MARTVGRTLLRWWGAAPFDWGQGAAVLLAAASSTVSRRVLPHGAVSEHEGRLHGPRDEPRRAYVRRKRDAGRRGVRVLQREERRGLHPDSLGRGRLRLGVGHCEEDDSPLCHLCERRSPLHLLDRRQQGVPSCHSRARARRASPSLAFVLPGCRCRGQGPVGQHRRPPGALAWLGLAPLGRSTHR